MLPIIREMNINDTKRIAELTAQLGYPISDEAMLSRVQLFLHNPYGKVFVAEINNTVVGYVCLWIREHFHDTHRAARILALVVDSNHQRLGIGKKLIHAAEQFAQEQKCISIDLTSAHRRTDAHTFYKNLGYQTDQTGYFSKDL